MSMTPSIRSKIVDGVIARLGNITKANGYNTQVGTSRVYPFERTPTRLPNNSIVVYWSGEIIRGPVANDRYEVEASVSVGFYVSDSSRDPTGAGEALLSDIQACMGNGLNNPDDLRLTVSVQNYGSGVSGDQKVEILEISNSLNPGGDSARGVVVGQVDYLVRYYRNAHRPDKS
jgi:hypothetical protein